MLIRTFVLVFSVFSIFLFGGCVRNNDVFILGQFESEIDIKAKNTEYKGTVFFNGVDSTSFVFSSPEALEGISVTSNSSGTKYAVGDTEYSTQEGDNALFLLNSVLMDMKNKTICIDSVNSLSTNDEAYEVVIDESGTNVSIVSGQYQYSFCVV